VKKVKRISGFRFGTILLNQAEFTGMPHPNRKETNSSLRRMKQTSEVTVLSLNTGMNITTLNNTGLTVAVSKCE
jgi:hypothetical protein